MYTVQTVWGLQQKNPKLLAPCRQFNLHRNLFIIPSCNPVLEKCWFRSSTCRCKLVLAGRAVFLFSISRHTLTSRKNYTCFLLTSNASPDMSVSKQFPFIEASQEYAKFLHPPPIHHRNSVCTTLCTKKRIPVVFLPFQNGFFIFWFNLTWKNNWV